MTFSISHPTHMDSVIAAHVLWANCLVWWYCEVVGINSVQNFNSCRPIQMRNCIGCLCHVSVEDCHHGNTDNKLWFTKVIYKSDLHIPVSLLFAASAGSDGGVAAPSTSPHPASHIRLPAPWHQQEALSNLRQEELQWQPATSPLPTLTASWGSKRG